MGLVPCNVIPEEILTDHPKRFRAMFIESANPVHSLADSQRMREAFRALELSVAIDVAVIAGGIVGGAVAVGGGCRRQTGAPASANAPER